MAEQPKVSKQVHFTYYTFLCNTTIFFISCLFKFTFCFLGDPLTMVISIDHQDIYGMHVSECYVRDGLGWSDQGLINDEGQYICLRFPFSCLFSFNLLTTYFSISGCPVDWEIMGEFEYSSSKTTALVHFQAHKFPYTSSVYYQCNVRLCIRHAGGCEDTVSIYNLPIIQANQLIIMLSHCKFKFAIN